MPALWFAFFLIFVVVFLFMAEAGVALFDMPKYFNRLLVVTAVLTVAVFVGIMHRQLPQLAIGKAQGSMVTSHKTGVNFPHGLSNTTHKP